MKLRFSNRKSDLTNLGNVQIRDCTNVKYEIQNCVSSGCLPICTVNTVPHNDYLNVQLTSEAVTAWQ